MEERYESELAQSTRVLDDVDRALERLTSGTYDSCEVCGAVIPDAQLAVEPTHRVCDQHGADHEGHGSDHEGHGSDHEGIEGAGSGHQSVA